MKAQQSLIIAAAMLISAAGFVGIANYTSANAATAPIHATADVIPTLPTITVHPSAEQMRELRGDQAGAAPASLMPYYSFANDADSTGA